jgi:HlyD family secretion protein
MIKVLIIVTLLGAGGSAAYFLSDKSETPANGENDPTLYEVRRGDLNITLTENGTLVAKDSQKVSPQIRSRGKITFLIEEGTLVEEGELLCNLDTSDLEKQVEQLDLDIVKADADVHTARTELEIQIAENAANIEKAKIAVGKTAMEREKYLEGDSKKLRRQLEIAIKDAETNLERARKKHEDSEMLFKQDFINKSQLEEDKINFEKSQVQMESATIEMDIFERFDEPMALQDKDTASSDAKRGLDTSEKRAQSIKRQKEVAVEQHEKRLEKLQKQLEEKKEEIEKMELKAPCPGIVIHGDPRQPWYNEDIRVGGEIWGSYTIVTIPDLRVMQVKLQIHEADINKVKADQVAKITMDTYPGVILNGTVTKVAAIADSSRGQEVKKFDVEITIEKPQDLELKPGISAKAEVFVEEKTEVLSIPLQCVFIEEGEHFCYVEGLQIPERRQIKTGSSNDSFIEILEGLEKGDLVLLYNPNLPGGATDSGSGSESEPEEAPAEEEAASPAVAG